MAFSYRNNARFGDIIFACTIDNVSVTVLACLCHVFFFSSSVRSRFIRHVWSFRDILMYSAGYIIIDPLSLTVHRLNSVQSIDLHTPDALQSHDTCADIQLL